MLKICFTDSKRPAFWAMEKNFSIGRAKSNHLCLDDASIDEVHARIINRGDNFLLKDLGSKTGVFVNGTRITQKTIGCGDQIQIGDIGLDIVDPFLNRDANEQWSLIADSSWLRGQEFPLQFSHQNSTLTIGRANDCDIVIPSTHLSRKHALLQFTNEEYLQLRDLDSVNGSFVNDKRVGDARLQAGDRVRFDVYSFRLFGPGIELPRAATSKFAAISPEESAQERDERPKQWKTKATSPGNREQEDLYSGRWRAPLIALSMIAIFVAVAVYYLVF
jgi:pSer/pThr/pTyr-binding forkhead associated (FHA) protein